MNSLTKTRCALAAAVFASTLLLACGTSSSGGGSSAEPDTDATYVDSPDSDVSIDDDSDVQVDFETVDEPDESADESTADANESDVTEDAIDETDGDIEADTADSSEADAWTGDEMQVMFTINTHDWVFVEDSVATLNRVIDIHERYDVPVDIYLTDPMVQVYQSDYPELITRMRDSDLVAVSYHVRPPAPYYPNFDHAGLGDLSDADLYDAVMEYETHSLDLEWGVPGDSQGGYAYLAELMGYEPPAVGTNSGGPMTSTIFRVFRDLGATFQVAHGRHYDLGDRSNGSLLRPEQVEIKLYEYRRGEVASDVLEDRIAEECDAPSVCNDTIYVNIKFHENNWYTQDTAWWPVFYEDRTKSSRLDPPFDLDASEGVIRYKPEQQINNLWEIYEDAVVYVVEHPERFRPINVFTLQRAAEEL